MKVQENLENSQENQINIDNDKHVNEEENFCHVTYI